MFIYSLKQFRYMSNIVTQLDMVPTAQRQGIYKFIYSCLLDTLQIPCPYWEFCQLVFISLTTSKPTVNKVLFFCLGFLSNILDSQDTRGRGRLFLWLLLTTSPTSHKLRHQSGDYCRELTSAHSQRPDSNREPLVSEWMLQVSLLSRCFLHFSNITINEC